MTRIEDLQEDQEASAEGYCAVRNPRSMRIIGFTLISKRLGLV